MIKMPIIEVEQLEVKPNTSVYKVTVDRRVEDQFLEAMTDIRL